MNGDRQDIEFNELFDFVSGTLPAERASELAARLAHDEELASQVAFVRLLNPQDEEDQREGTDQPVTDALPPRSANSLRRIAATLVTTVVLGTGFGVAWAFFRDPPLLRDNFDDRTFDAYLWMPQPAVHARADMTTHMGVTPRNGYMKLVNRGYLITRSEFAEPVSLTFDWSWSALGMKPVYAEDLSVVLRTTGDVSPEYPYEILDGIVIRFHAWGPFVNISTRGEFALLGSTEDKSIELPIPADEWHTIRITDDGEMIAVYITGPEIGNRFRTTPVLEVRADGEFKGRHIAIYNREHVGGVPHESLIDNVVVRRFAGSDVQ